MKKCFFLFRSVDDFVNQQLCCFQLQIRVTCSTLSHCILVNNLKIMLIRNKTEFTKA